MSNTCVAWDILEELAGFGSDEQLGSGGFGPLEGDLGCEFWVIEHHFFQLLALCGGQFSTEVGSDQVVCCVLFHSGTFLIRSLQISGRVFSST